MGLNAIEGGLHRIRNRSKQTAKVTVHVAPGDELAVSHDVALQLEAGDHNAFSAVEPAVEPAVDDETPPADDDQDRKSVV